MKKVITFICAVVFSFSAMTENAQAQQTLSADQLTKLTNEFTKAMSHMSSETAQKWIDNPELFERAVHEALIKRGNSMFIITPIYDIEEGKEKGNYGFIYDWIGEVNTPIKVKDNEKLEKVEVELIDLGRSVSTEAALRALEKKGRRPATSAELLGFGAQYPLEQKKHPIVVLPTQKEIDNNSVFNLWDSRPSALFLYWDGDDRGMALRWLGRDWETRWRFLAVRLPGFH